MPRGQTDPRHDGVVVNPVVVVLVVVEVAAVLEDVAAVDDGGGFEVDLFARLEDLEEEGLVASAGEGRHASVLRVWFPFISPRALDARLKENQEENRLERGFGQTSLSLFRSWVSRISRRKKNFVLCNAVFDSRKIPLPSKTKET